MLLSVQGHPTAGSLAALVVGAGLCLLARWRGWMLPGADAWSPAQVVPAYYRIRGRRQRGSQTGRTGNAQREEPDD